MPTIVRIGPRDTALHEAYLRYVARLFRSVEFRAWHAFGGWTEDYQACAVVEGGEVVANVSVMRQRLVVEGREVSGAQLGAVGCVPERRGSGLVRAVMEEALRSLGDAPALLYANDAVLDFYPRFGFRRIAEARFEVEMRLAPAGEPAGCLDLADPVARTAWLAACAGALAPTERLGARAYGSAALWHACNFYRHAIRILPEQDAYVVAVQRGEVLEVLDVAAPRPLDLEAALPRLAEGPVARVRFGFCPERWAQDGRGAPDPESTLFVRGLEPSGPLRFPALAQT